jgi:hypothetical protein
MAQPPICHDRIVNLCPYCAAIRLSTASVSLTTSGPMPSPGNNTICASTLVLSLMTVSETL